MAEDDKACTRVDELDMKAICHICSLPFCLIPNKLSSRDSYTTRKRCNMVTVMERGILIALQPHLARFLTN